MARLSTSYSLNVRNLSERLKTRKSFDSIERQLRVAGKDMTMYYLDGFVKDGEMQRIIGSLTGMKELGTAEELLKVLPYVEVDICTELEEAVVAVLSGQTVIIAESFGDTAILVDARTYPTRPTGEPASDRVIEGPREGFVETLVINTALIRRRIRDTRLTMSHRRIGSSSGTDVVVCYMEGLADPELVKDIGQRLDKIKTKSLSLGHRSLAESMLRRGWLNPFPKVRTTERPDTAAAQLLEGDVLIICDTSPEVMILPTSIFDFLQQADDYYFPPLTGTYLRIIRTMILLLSLVATPLWYLAVRYADILPETLRVLVPDDPGALPIILQLLLVEVAVDGLKIASMNTPDMLSNSLSVIGALILGDFAVEVGWLCPDVILYMAFVSIAGFAQQNAELGYAFKFIRMLTLLFVFGFGVWGLIPAGVILTVALLTNKTLSSRRGYLYPLVPFDGRALCHLLFRTKKRDFEPRKEQTTQRQQM